MVSTRSRRNKAAVKPSSENHKSTKNSLKKVSKSSSKVPLKPPSKPQTSVSKKSSSSKGSKVSKVQPSKPKQLSRSKQTTKPSPKPLPAKPVKPTGGSSKSNSKYPQYSASQLSDFKKHQLDLDSNKLPELKDMCRKNQMKISGTKPELVERIADAMILGVIPKCPECGGGRPKLDVKTMTYHCAGYRDDVDFVNCHKTFSYSSIIRVPWQD